MEPSRKVKTVPILLILLSMQNFRIPEDKKPALQKFKEYVAEKGE